MEAVSLTNHSLSHITLFSDGKKFQRNFKEYQRIHTSTFKHSSKLCMSERGFGGIQLVHCSFVMSSVTGLISLRLPSWVFVVLSNP